MAEPHDDAPTPEAAPAPRVTTPLDAGALEAALQGAPVADGPFAAPTTGERRDTSPVGAEARSSSTVEVEPAALASRTGLERTTRSVAAIVEAAEQAATQMRAEAERRARERIAEADRAAALRVDAAESESREILSEAQRDAAQARSAAQAAVAGIHAEAQRVREEAEKGRLAAAAEGASEATRIRQEAEVDARRLRGVQAAGAPPRCPPRSPTCSAPTTARSRSPTSRGRSADDVSRPAGREW